MIAVDPYSGDVLDVYDSRKHGSVGRLLLQWAYPLHFGLWGGLATRILYVFLGFVPAVALVTGFWRWRRRRAAERKSRRRLAVVLQSAPLAVREALRRKGLDEGLESTL